MRTALSSLRVSGSEDDLAAVKAAEADLLEAARGTSVGYEAGEFAVTAVLEDA
jgi:hypothetical protein